MNLYFVLCPRFHGATTLGLLLNNHSRVSSLGDMFPSSEFDQSCGCGLKVSQCPFWAMIGHKFPSFRRSNAGSLYPLWPQLIDRWSGNDALVRAVSLTSLHTTPGVWKLFGSGARRFAEFYVDFVAAVNEYNGSTVFVNGQKSLRSVLAIKSILGDNARINIIHLTRDPRGAFCSESETDGTIDVTTFAKRWRQYHRRVARYMRPLLDAKYLAIRYEDLCEQPEPTMGKVFDFIGVGYESVFRPAPVHHLVGHRSKDRFDGTLRQSLKWKNSLSAAQQVRCLELTRPESTLLGYQ